MSVEDGENTASYTYDGNNLRQSKTVNGVTTTHIYDGAEVTADITGDRQSVYVRDLNGILFREENGEKMHYISNPRGDVSAYYYSRTRLLPTYTYDAFGNQTEASGTDPFRYSGEYYDAESGFIYLRNRYYDPSIGRFITEDPAQSGTNWYVYANNNPLIYIDPWGLYAVGDEKLSLVIQQIINGTDGKIGGLTAKWHAAKTQKERDNIAKVANMLRCETTDYDITKSSSALLLLNEKAVGSYPVSAGHMAVMIKNTDGQGIYFSYAGESGGSPIDKGEMSMDILSASEVSSFLSSGYLSMAYTSSGELNSSSYTHYIEIPISSIQGSSMIGQGINFFWNPKMYFITGNQCNNRASAILAAGNREYKVKITPRQSFGDAAKKFGVPERRFGN